MYKTIISLGLISFAAPALAQDVAAEKAEPEAEAQPMSLAEFTSEQRTLFNKADTNFDGKITRDEAQMINQERKIKDYEKRFKKLDTNFNGFLDLSEVRDWHETNTESRVSRYEGQKTAVLNKYDTDGNGTISAYELDAYFEKLAEKQMNAVEQNAQRDFNKKDKDQSGAISLEEYLDSKKPKRTLGAANKMKDKIIARDADMDGEISRSENENFITNLFERLDKNKDESLSAKEQGHRAYEIFQTFSPNSSYLFSDQFPKLTIERPQR